MIIKDDKKIKAVQEEFNAKFPYLKIEFYTGTHAAGEGSPNKELLSSDLSIGEARSTHNAGDIKISPDMSVNSLETLFSSNYGLNVQVFRNSGSVWLQTTRTDDWTLEKQNGLAEAEMA